MASPPWNSAISRTMYRPRPKWGRLSGPVRDCHSDSKRRPWTCAAKAGPGLSTSMSAACASRRSRTLISAPAGLKSTALSMSLSSICTMRSGAPRTATGSVGNSARKVRSGKAPR